MKDREYFEQLISRSQDETLSEVELAELSEALRRIPELAAFQLRLVQQAARVRTLPQFEMRTELKLDQEARSSRQPAAWWRRKLSTPWPVAAAFAALLLAVGFLGRTPHDTAPPESSVQTVEYERTVRLRPSQAVLIDSTVNNEQGEEEIL